MQFVKAVVAVVLVGGAVAFGALLLLPRPSPAPKAPTVTPEALAPGAMTPILPAIEFLLLPGTAKLREREFKLTGSHAYAVELLERKLPRQKWTYFSTTARHYPKGEVVCRGRSPRHVVGESHHADHP